MWKKKDKTRFVRRKCKRISWYNFWFLQRSEYWRKNKGGFGNVACVSNNISLNKLPLGHLGSFVCVTESQRLADGVIFIQGHPGGARLTRAARPLPCFVNSPDFITLLFIKYIYAHLFFFSLFFFRMNRPMRLKFFSVHQGVRNRLEDAERRGRTFVRVILLIT